MIQRRIRYSNLNNPVRQAVKRPLALARNTDTSIRLFEVRLGYADSGTPKSDRFILIDMFEYPQTYLNFPSGHKTDIPQEEDEYSGQRRVGVG